MGSQVAARETTTICEAGEIIRTLTPPRLATLSELKEGHETQLEIASALDRSSSLISKHLGAFENLPVAIVNKADLGITDVGNEILGQLKSMARRLNVDFDTALQEEIADIEYCLSPLFAARGPLLFLVFHSIGVNNSVGDQIKLLQQEEIQTASIVSDVESRQQDRGESVGRKQIRWQLKQLADADSIQFENERIRLSEKGEAQLRFFEQVIQILESEYNDEDESLADSASERSLLPRDDLESSGVAVNFDIESEQFSIVPELHLDGDVISLADGMTVAEFIEQTACLSHHESDAELRLKLMLRSQTTESDLLVD